MGRGVSGVYRFVVTAGGNPSREARSGALAAQPQHAIGNLLQLLLIVRLIKTLRHHLQRRIHINLPLPGCAQCTSRTIRA